MKTALKLVPAIPSFYDLIDALESLLDDHMTLERKEYGTSIAHRCPCIYVTNTENGAEMRIIFDLHSDFGRRQGVHTSLDIDAYELAEKLDRACDDGFDTIWLHSYRLG